MASFLINTPRFFQYELKYDEKGNLIGGTKSATLSMETRFGIIYNHVLFNSLVLLIPVLMLMLLNIRLILRLKDMRRRRWAMLWPNSGRRRRNGEISRILKLRNALKRERDTIKRRNSTGSLEAEALREKLQEGENSLAGSTTEMHRVSIDPSRQSSEVAHGTIVPNFNQCTTELDRLAMLRRLERREGNITLVALTIIIIMVICHTPDRVVMLLKLFLGTIRSCESGWFFYLALISNLFVLLNSASSIFVYYLFRRRFRKHLYDLFCCTRSERMVSSNQKSFSRVNDRLSVARNSISSMWSITPTPTAQLVKPRFRLPTLSPVLNKKNKSDTNNGVSNGSLTDKQRSQSVILL